MAKTKARAEIRDRPSASTDVERRPEPAEREPRSGPQPAAPVRAAADLLPPPNGEPAPARAAGVLSFEGSGAASRARLMAGMQQTVGNARAGRMLAEAPAPIEPAAPTPLTEPKETPPQPSPAPQEREPEAPQGATASSLGFQPQVGELAKPPSPEGAAATTGGFAAAGAAPAVEPEAPAKEGAEAPPAPAPKGEAAPLADSAPADEGGPAAEGPKAPASPEEDPAFRAVQARAGAAARQQKSHGSAGAAAGAAQAAAEGPPNEVADQAAGAQVGKMDAQQPQPFDRAAFKAALLEKIAAITPKTLEEADEFKDSGKVGEVKSAVTSNVAESKEQAQGPIAQTAKEPPDPSGFEPKPVTPLSPTDPGPPPPDLGAAGAAPKPKTASEVEAPMAEASQSLDQQMADADITEEQLATSNEPEFQAALDSKGQAQAHAAEAPDAYRASEQSTLAVAQTQAESTATTETEAMHGARAALLSGVTGEQEATRSADEQKHAEVSQRIQEIYHDTKKKVEDRLNALDQEVYGLFDRGAEAARVAFEAHVELRMDAYKAERYSGLDGPYNWTRDLFCDLPDEVNVFYVEGRDLYIAKMDGVIDEIATAVETGLTEAKDLVAIGRQAVQDYVTSLPLDLQQVGQEAANSIQTRFDDLEQSIKDKQGQLIDSLAQKYVDNLQKIDARIEELKAANRGLVNRAFDAVAGVVRTILELKDMLLGVLGKAAGVIRQIIKDPIGFLGNLVEGVSQGLSGFRANLGTHLKEGLFAWLFGALAEAGIQVPESFDLKGILSLILQVLGLTYENIRARAVAIVGEPVVSALEKTAEVFKVLVTEGPAGLWQFIQDKLTEIKDTVLEEIRSYVQESVIVAGITWLLSLLNPVAAFIKACKAIYNIVMFFVTRGSQVMALVNAILDSLGAIASGAVAGAAAAVENALAKAIPVVIGFLASLLGLGGISDKIRAILQKVQAPVNKAIDFVIRQAVKVAKAAGGVLGIGDDEEDVEEAEEAPIVVDAPMSGVGHTLTAVPGSDEEVEMASSNPGRLSVKLKAKLNELKRRDPKPDKQIEALATLHSKVKSVERQIRKYDRKSQKKRKKMPLERHPIKIQLEEMVAALASYSAEFHETDIDPLAGNDEVGNLREHSGYHWLAAKGLHTSFETRIIAHIDSFNVDNIKAILDKIDRFKGSAGFEAKVKRAVNSNLFWSPNIGYFYEISSLSSLDDIRFLEVQVGGSRIDILTGTGKLIEQKSEVQMNEAGTDLDPHLRAQLNDMQAALGTEVEGIIVTSIQVLHLKPLSAAVEAILTSDGLSHLFRLE